MLKLFSFFYSKDIKGCFDWFAPKYREQIKYVLKSIMTGH